MERADLARRLGAEPRAAEAAAEPAVVAESDPRRFMGAFSQAVAGGGPVFLADPGWGADERAALEAMARRPEAGDGRGWLMIPSGGTSGRLKFARHDEGTLAAAVRGFCAHFGTERANWVGVLPLHHVSGLMAWMRAALTGGEYLPWDWKRLEREDFPEIPRDGSRWFLSLVPTQVQRLLDSPTANRWLRGFDAIFVGGGPAWPSLARRAAEQGLRLSLSYGMTETAAMVAALLPEEFLEGSRDCGRVMPHAQVDLTEDGRVRVAGESVFRGYFPEVISTREIVTEDLGEFDARGHLTILGRRDMVIITGGKKVDPAEVESALRAGTEFADVAVVGVPDAEWGEVVVACYPDGGRTPDPIRVASLLSVLAAFKRPRRLVPISDWPRTAQGKINRAELARRAAAVKGSHC